MTTKSRSPASQQTRLNFETLMWIFTRLSALALYRFCWLASLARLSWERAPR